MVWDVEVVLRLVLHGCYSRVLTQLCHWHRLMVVSTFRIDVQGILLDSRWENFKLFDRLCLVYLRKLELFGAPLLKQRVLGGEKSVEFKALGVLQMRR